MSELQNIEAIDESEADIDYEVTGNVMTLEFENREPNHYQPPRTNERNHSLASKSGGFHFKLIDDKWTCSQDGHGIV
ncbi:hypothetical protein O9993_20515 [Vibrio lentus]|nr:hypothetical protein [Vibrio lentus]